MKPTSACAFIVAILLFACNSGAPEPDLAANKELVRRYHAAWSSGKIDQLPALLDTGFVLHFMGNYEYNGIEGAKQAIADTRNAFPDWNESINDLIAEGTRLVSLYRSTGTQQGRYDTVPPSGNKVDILETSIYHIEHGRIVEEWAFWDEILFQRQMKESEGLKIESKR